VRPVALRGILIEQYNEAVAEGRRYLCDRHCGRLGVRFVQGYWMCEACVLRYLRRLRWERYNL
jgi:hypothetical protein